MGQGLVEAKEVRVRSVHDGAAAVAEEGSAQKDLERSIKHNMCLDEDGETTDVDAESGQESQRLCGGSMSALNDDAAFFENR